MVYVCMWFVWYVYMWYVCICGVCGMCVYVVYVVCVCGCVRERERERDHSVLTVTTSLSAHIPWLNIMLPSILSSLNCALFLFAHSLLLFIVNLDKMNQ